jgi:hypothetical protein
VPKGKNFSNGNWQLLRMIVYICPYTQRPTDETTKRQRPQTIPEALCFTGIGYFFGE